ncbi:MAG: hypothetical protein L7U87_02385 [Chlamydiales bacterium]|nr:hypothetical protein [Chlamydiales bacterium]
MIRTLYFFTALLLLTSCDCEKDISQSSEVAFLINKQLTLKEPAFIIHNNHLDMNLLEVPGSSYGVPTLQEYMQNQADPQDKNYSILAIVPKGTELHLDKVTRRRPLFSEEQLLVWSTVDGREVVINPSLDYMALPDNPYQKAFEHPHFLSLLDY